MIAPPVGARILLATKPVDFRKGAHSLAALAAEVLGADPFSGAVLVFRSRRADRIKILLWDGQRPGPGLEAVGGFRVPLAGDRGRRGPLAAAVRRRDHHAGPRPRSSVLPRLPAARGGD
jgi:hypothetical protein